MRAKFDIFNGEIFVESVVRDFRELRIGSLNLPGWLSVPPDDVSRLHAIIDANMILNGFDVDRTTVNGKMVNTCQLVSGDQVGIGSVVRVVVEFPVALEVVQAEYIPPGRR